MQSSDAQTVAWQDFLLRESAIVSRLKTEATGAVGLVREVARAIRWFGSQQPEAAVGSQHGIVTDGAFTLVSGTYQLNARAHTAVGKPAVQLVVFDKRFSREVADEDRSLFLAIVERVSRGAVVTSWDADLVYSVAIDVPVHPSLLKAVGLNRRRFETCSDPASHREAFIVPSGWHR